MQKKLKKIYLINLIIFIVLIPLIILVTILLMGAAISKLNPSNSGEALVLPLVAIMIFALYLALAIIFIAADIISLVIAIICFCKIGNVQSKRQAKKFAIFSIIFIGNIVPGIMILKSKEEQFVNNFNQQ